MNDKKHRTAQAVPVERDVRLTIWARLKICFEVLTIRSGNRHSAQEKQLPTFIRGYEAGLKDGKLEYGKPLTDLLYAVERKFPDETRFETALRYIREAENRSMNCGQTSSVSNAKLTSPHE